MSTWLKDRGRQKPQGSGSSIGSRACAAALAVALCGMPLLPPLALADDDATTADVVQDVSGDEAVDNSDEQLDPGEDVGTDPDPNSEEPAEDNPPAIDEPDSSPDPDEESVSPAEQDENALAAAEDGMPADPQVNVISKGTREATRTKLEGKLTKAQQAAELRAQAEAIVGQMDMMAAEWDKCQAELEDAKADLERAKAAGGEKRKQLKASKKKLEKLRARLSEYVVEMYKRGGVTPYLDALVRSTSYREAVTAWYMLDEVSSFGQEELHEQVEAVEKLEAEMETFEKQVEKAERAVQETQSRLNRAKLIYLSLSPHVARLCMEADLLEGNDSAAAAEKAEYEAACAVLEEAIASGLKLDGKLEGQGIFTHPCPDADYSSGFGYRTFDHSYHLGLDMAIGEGTPYYAADDGVVIDATNGGGYNGGAGNWIVIEHDNGVVTKYMHSLTTLVQPGDRVVRGQAIGLVGNTGNSFGAHLHFQVEVNDTAVDPIIYL